MSSSTGGEKRGFSPKAAGARAARHFRDIRGEMKRVVWPAKKQVLNNTGIVLMFMAIASIFIGLFDLGLSEIIRLIQGV